MIPKEEKWDSHTVSSKCMVENKPCHVLRDEWANKRTKGKRVGIPVFSPSGMKPRVRNKCTPAQPELVVDYNSWAWVEKPSFPNKDCLCELTSFAELWDSLCGNVGAKWSFLFFFFFWFFFFFLSFHPEAPKYMFSFFSSSHYGRIYLARWLNSGHGTQIINSYLLLWMVKNHFIAEFRCIRSLLSKKLL